MNRRISAALALIALGGAAAAAYAGAPRFSHVTDARGPAPFAQEIPTPDEATLDQRLLGRSFFSIPWVAAPAATTARDGLGPLFNANTCTSCHEGNGSAATISADGKPLRPLLFKLARPGAHDQRMDQTNPEMPSHGRMIDPTYGAQIAINATGHAPTEPRPEARPRLTITPERVRYNDGTQRTLQRLTPRLDDLAYGPLAADTVIFLRQPPALAGLGLIETIPDAQILAYEDPEDADGNGISGRANRLPSGQIGRYGWKADEPTLVAQIASAAAADMGLTNSHYPEELCQPGQTACLAAPRGRPSPQGMHDLPDERLNAIAAYLSGFKSPHPLSLTPEAQRGEQLFASTGCTACHRPEISTSDGRTLRPLSDFLLHDMGPRLADGARVHDAGPAEFRTAPLWGLGARLRAGHRFLHDARARTPEEAILWHGGEARTSRETFMTLERADRAALLTYLEQL
ncbi:di-heme oxidoredictase family protein [Rhodalgimonas zhirmunskyi]|uniref:C-type cytochrome n=1 Tax=Rhodalgimonas zhirmunskyi TaxID=2964767 RepID=A0AAJ1X3W8_9RHOB|nr:di-heme oxidoredictase family protein [Rhodoalgimonas zhirmunskyi]MDQ2093713.1 c-type cytochrome [Rhodoalgimonas zhirmunskyi]